MSSFSIKALIHSASDLLAECSDSPKLDAQILLAHVLNKETTYLFTWADKLVDTQQCSDFQALLARRLKGEPIAYLVGMKEFWSLSLAVAPSTLIPRPDTETLVELVLEHFERETLSILDLGTGTGAIALALASEHPTWNITGVDYNQDAVVLAKTNREQLGFNNVTIYRSDWFQSVESNSLFDVIVSNPPYIDEQDHHLDQGDVRFEPKSALVAGNKGLADIEHITREGQRFLNPNGRLYVEHGYQQGNAVRQIFEDLGYQNITTVEDLGGNERITWASSSK